MPKQSAPTKTAAPKNNLSHIAAALRPMAMDLRKFKLDPKNSLKHAEKDLAATSASLKEFGQLKPIVVQRSSGRIVAGNGTYQAALRLGWTHLAVAIVDLNDAQAKRFGIVDNQTGRNAEWDFENLDSLLAELRELGPSGTDGIDQLLADVSSFTADALASAEGTKGPKERQSASREGRITLRTGVEQKTPIHEIVITCKSARTQEKLFEEFKRRGLHARTVIK